jgi:hypothetical protein
MPKSNTFFTLFSFIDFNLFLQKTNLHSSSFLDLHRLRMRRDRKVRKENMALLKIEHYRFPALFSTEYLRMELR